MMKRFLAPAALCMQRLRLLPKFLLLALVLGVPMLLLCAVLLSELQRSIADTRAEQAGLRFIGALQQASAQLTRHRASQHLALSAKSADAATQAAGARRELDAAFSALAALHAQDGALLGNAQSWQTVRAGWAALPATPLDARAALAADTALLARMRLLAAGVADATRVSLDPEPASNRLAALVLQAAPAASDALADLAGRGAAYIDTGLLAPGEDLLLASTAMAARIELERAREQLAPMLATDPRLNVLMQPAAAALPVALAFLERHRNEVGNAYGQTSGREFLAAGLAAADGVQALRRQAAQRLSLLLEERLARSVLRRNLVAGAIAGAIALAAYLLAGLYASFSRDLAHLQRAVKSVAEGDLSRAIASN
ncbi:MAG TPA: methyl-accepting chemotaxis protein, partial [Burkholderiaceae bacterium]